MDDPPCIIGCQIGTEEADHCKGKDQCQQALQEISMGRYFYHVLTTLHQKKLPPLLHCFSFLFLFFNHIFNPVALHLS